MSTYDDLCNLAITPAQALNAMSLGKPDGSDDRLVLRELATMVRKDRADKEHYAGELAEAWRALGHDPEGLRPVGWTLADAIRQLTKVDE